MDTQKRKHTYVMHEKGPGICVIILDEVCKRTNKLSMDKTDDFWDNLARRTVLAKSEVAQALHPRAQLRSCSRFR